MSRKGPSTTGVSSFDPDHLFSDPETHTKARSGLNQNNLQAAIKAAFNLPATDRYTYHATASVTLAQAQQAVEAGPANGLCAWYLDPEIVTDADGAQRRRILYPSTDEVAAYISLFDPTKSGANLLKGFKANAKKGSLRAGIAKHLSDKRYVDPSVVISRSKAGHANVYADFWAWSCYSLQYAGPDERLTEIHQSHHVLPVFMHHFGCVCPSYESIEVLRTVSKGRTVLDIGSGNGYWTYMLRRAGMNVLAVDNGQSTWRTIWISDTIDTDGAKFLKRRKNGGAEDVLMLVYPVVGLEFTTSIVNAYKGDLICVAGTQNGNGYTGFQNETMDVWMAREKTDFEKIVQLPLPSFAGKDDALFVFRKKSDKSETKEE